MRAYNERLVLSLVRRHGALSKAEIAKRSGLTAQTVSVIMRALEDDSLLLRGEPVRGKVGQPSIPMSINPDGAFAMGLKIGRRSAELVLVDFIGRTRSSVQLGYAYPVPHKLRAFATHSIEQLRATLKPAWRKRISGIGISMPFELWNWAAKIGAPQKEMDAWRQTDFAAELQDLCNLPVFLQNDATAACGAELAFGQGQVLSDFIYFFIGTFIGGGVVLNHTVYAGRSGNAAALGSMPILDKRGKASQLIDHASLITLESMLTEQGIDGSLIWQADTDWREFGEPLQQWVQITAEFLALAIISSCSVIDFEAAIIDGGFPEHVREQLLDATRIAIDSLDMQGIQKPKLLSGAVGSGARAIGGAGLPLLARYLLDQDVLFKDRA